MDEYWNEALNEISDEHLAEAIKPKRRISWFSVLTAGLAAAMLLVLISPLALLTLFFGGMGASAPGSNVPHWDNYQGISGLVAAAEYPEMVSYPSDPDGKRDDDQEHAAWKASIKAQYNQPDGYGDNLTEFFVTSTPLFMDGATENAVCSPLNIYMAMAMLAEITGGDSQEKLLEVLDADSLEALRTQAGQLWNAHYRADGSMAVLLANSLWLDRGYTFNRNTAETVADRYYASVFQGDLGGASMNNALKAWLDVQTQGLLQEYSQAEGFTADTALALASTVYFSAKWNDEFLAAENKEGVFHTPAGDVDATYMTRTTQYQYYYYGEDYGAINLRLGRSSYDYTMWLILPDEGYDPQEVLESGHALGMILGAEEQQYKELKVHLSLPKFDISAETDLREGLTALGLGDLFDPDTADFSSILPDATGDYLSQANHAARVTVDEEGVTAAAYTLMTYYGAPAPKEEEIWFTLDRPFIFVITSHDNLPLFVGVVNEP